MRRLKGGHLADGGIERGRRAADSARYLTPLPAYTSTCCIICTASVL